MNLRPIKGISWRLEELRVRLNLFIQRRQTLELFLSCGFVIRLKSPIRIHGPVMVLWIEAHSTANALSIHNHSATTHFLNVTFESSFLLVSGGLDTSVVAYIALHVLAKEKQ